MPHDIAFDDASLLIGLGAARAGSTWISNYFERHNEILMSPIRVLHHFDPSDAFEHIYVKRVEALESTRASDRRAREAPPPRALADYRERVAMHGNDTAFIGYFRRRWAGERVFVDVTPSYANLDREVFRRMRSVHPKVRFLFVMRNPIDRYWSVMRKAKTEDPAFDLYGKLDYRLGGRKPLWPHTYTDTLTELDAATPTADTAVFFFEDLFNMESMDRLCNFLGVETAPADFARVLNSSAAAELSLERRRKIYAKFASVYEFMHARFSGRLPASWLEDMERFATTPAEPAVPAA
jgi:hypothetical protein